MLNCGQVTVTNNTTTVFSVVAVYDNTNQPTTVPYALKLNESVTFNCCSQQSDYPQIPLGLNIYYIQITNPGNGNNYGFWISEMDHQTIAEDQPGADLPGLNPNNPGNFADPGKFKFSLKQGTINIGGCFSCDGTTCCPDGDSTCNGTTCEFLGSAPGEWGESCIDGTACEGNLNCITGLGGESVCCIGQSANQPLSGGTMCCAADVNPLACAKALCNTQQCAQGCYNGVCCDDCLSGCDNQQCGLQGICNNGDCCDSGVLNNGVCCDSGILCGSNPPQCCDSDTSCSNGVCCATGYYGTNGICCATGLYGTNGICCATDLVGTNGVCCAPGQVGCDGACCNPCGNGVCSVEKTCTKTPLMNPATGRFIGWSYSCD
jgi:hypothetical protein